MDRNLIGKVGSRKFFRHLEEKIIVSVVLLIAGGFFFYFYSDYINTVKELNVENAISRGNISKAAELVASESVSYEFPNNTELASLFGVPFDEPVDKVIAMNASSTKPASITGEISKKNLISTNSEKISGKGPVSKKQNLASPTLIATGKTASDSLRAEKKVEKKTNSQGKQTASGTTKIATPTLELSAIGYRLKGIIHDKRGKSSTVFLFDPMRGHDVVIKTGASDTIRILKISSREVTLSTPKGDGILKLLDLTPVSKNASSTAMASLPGKKNTDPQNQDTDQKENVASSTTKADLVAGMKLLTSGDVETIKKDGSYIVVLKNVQPNSELAKAGFKSGDVISGIGGSIFKKANEIPELLAKFSTSQIKANLIRDGHEMTIDAPAMRRMRTQSQASHPEFPQTSNSPLGVTSSQLPLTSSLQSKNPPWPPNSQISANQSWPGNQQLPTISSGQGNQSFRIIQPGQAIQPWSGNQSPTTNQPFQTSNQSFTSLNQSFQPANQPPQATNQAFQTTNQPFQPSTYKPPSPFRQSPPTDSSQKTSEVVVGPIYQTGGSFPR
ncbi:MAG: hypothetical protein HQM08_04635 [Candidatus Riflebacteria bacterium]|nr:hypothetical protein [Candidatus Riflebacteria bacterium]